jgi:hypothetical protein
VLLAELEEIRALARELGVVESPVEDYDVGWTTDDV